METYEQKEIKALLDDSAKFGYKLKITSDNEETKWLYIDEKILFEVYKLFISK